MASDREKRVRERAYQIWQREGEPPGRAAEHWAQAEAEIELEHELATDRAAAGQKPTTEAPLRSEPARRAERNEKAPAKRRRGEAEAT
ncbi:MAG TPA: DUF2934 domain-containing protein [Stellaceae bacterium]|nr:DUF2934 domain-containing protein [Stellaceae bacterium]